MFERNGRKKIKSTYIIVTCNESNTMKKYNFRVITMSRATPRLIMKILFIHLRNIAGKEQLCLLS